jgi:HlyD family secretion protein
MQNNTSRVLLWSGIGLILILCLAYLFWPRSVIVDTAKLIKSKLQVSISDEAKTQLHDIYILSAPVTGYLRRINAEVGDTVNRTETILAQIEPIDPSFLDPRSEAQAKSAIQAANAALSLSRAELNQAQAELDFAISEFNRMRELRVQNNISERELDNAKRIYKTAVAVLATAEAALQMRIYELEQNKALLISPSSTQTEHGNCECINITSPVSGRILQVLNKSEGVVAAGTQLMEIGDPNKLEIIVELLSFDAVKVEPGQRVFIKNWGGSMPLEGRVDHIEPIGFKKVSSLGIEEQRVNVIINLTSEAELYRRLGHGYQVDVDIILWEGDEVLSVPLTALFRDKSEWAVFAIKNGKVRTRIVEVGRRNAFNAQILSGLQEGDWFILYPNDQIADGVSISSRINYAE